MKLDFQRPFEDDPLPPDQEINLNARQLWALGAALMVLLLGVALLLISSATSTTAPTNNNSNLSQIIPSAASSVSASKPQTFKKAVNEYSVSDDTNPAPSQTKVSFTEGAPIPAMRQEPPTTTLVPRLKPELSQKTTPPPAPQKIATTKPVRSALAEKPDDGFTPSLKPSRRIASISQSSFNDVRSSPKNTQATKAKLIHTHPLNLQPTNFVLAADNPPSFFSVYDIESKAKPTTPEFNTTIPIGDIEQPYKTVTLSLNRGETFVDMLARAQITRDDRNAVASAISKHIKLRQLRPGFEAEVTIAPPNLTWFQATMPRQPKSDHALISLTTRISETQEVNLKRGQNNVFNSLLSPIKMSKRLQSVSGRIDGNLYLSMKKQGTPNNTIDSLANIFAYDVDFQRDIFRGDRFEAIYEVWYDEDGNVVRGGDIMFAQLDWRGRTRSKGYYFYDPETSNGRADYYDDKGKSARRLLMKTPIDGARLSSGFGRRKHPILGYRKTHKGVDFAARSGTPIKATGDGVIERANRFGSYGNYIRIRHANGYKTAYAHLKGFARGIKKGRRVRQGDIIGYVGSTGRSTGPHLHYEVHLKNKPVNPQKLKIATGITLKGDALNGFNSERDAINRLRHPKATEQRFAIHETTSEPLLSDTR